MIYFNYEGDESLEYMENRIGEMYMKTLNVGAVIRYTQEDAGLSGRATKKVAKWASKGYSCIYEDANEFLPLVCTQEVYDYLEEEEPLVYAIYVNGSEEPLYEMDTEGMELDEYLDQYYPDSTLIKVYTDEVIEAD